MFPGNTPLFLKGTAFPTNPLLNDTFFRTDLGLLCYYDGTQWLTANVYSQTIPTTSIANNGSTGKMRLRTDYLKWVTRIAVSTFVGSPNDGSNYWTVQIRSANVAYTATTVVLQFTTQADTVSTLTDHEADATTHNPTNQGWFDLNGTKTGTPGALQSFVTIYYRLIIP